MVVSERAWDDDINSTAAADDGGQRRVEIVTGVGHWYRQCQGLVKVRWVFVHDLTGHHRDEYFYSTQPATSASDIIEAFVGRWDIEVTFEEMREHLGLETTRGRTRNTVLRVEPCLFLLHALITFWYSQLPKSHSGQIRVRWHGKTKITFSDAITDVRRCLWDESLFQHPKIRCHMKKLPRSARNAILMHSPFIRSGKSRVSSLLKNGDRHLALLLIQVNF